MAELTTNLNISGVPCSMIPEIDKVDERNRSRAVVELLKEALEARRARQAKNKKGA